MHNSMWRSPSLEEVGAGDVLVDGDAGDGVGQQVADILPLAFEGGSLGEARPFPAEDRVVGVAFEPAVGIPGAILVVMRIARLGLGGDGIRFEFLPLVQIVIEGDRHRVALADLVIAHRGRPSLLRKQLPLNMPETSPVGWCRQWNRSVLETWPQLWPRWSWKM